jgi:L-amino acid N-acyltransferase YncA
VPDGLRIRRAAPSDGAALARIYDEGIADGNATFATGPHDAEERQTWLASRPPHAPVFVGERDGEVVAWSALAPFSHREWYRGVAEYTVYVSRTARGGGLGRRMLEDLIRRAPAFGYWKLVGMIMPENGPGLALAEGAGFRAVGTHRAHTRLHGGWRDVTLVERHLEVPPPQV